jgi:hypothetical protein
VDVFQVMKLQFGFVKVRYRGLKEVIALDPSSKIVNVIHQTP